MAEMTYSTVLRNLADDYFNQRLSRQEYRARRKAIFEEIDREYNGHHKSGDVEPESDQSRFMHTIAFFKNRGIDKK